ncbi:MAG: hypothetical protein HDR56_02160 [Treponema sp.]|nr:hypothetical protein [Treponema sp.]
MKRITILCIALFFSAIPCFSQNDSPQDDPSGFSEIEKKRENNFVKRIEMPHRFFEMGWTVDFDISNNYFNIKDIFKEHIVIDFTEIAKNISKAGFLVNVNVSPSFFINLNLKNGFHFNISTGIESYGRVNIGKGLFDLLGNGKQLNKDVDIDLGISGDVFAYIGTAFGLNIQDYHIELMPSLYMPIFHVETSNGKATFSNNDDTFINATASATLACYSFLDLESFMKLDIDAMLENLKKGWGFDLYSSIEHPIFRSLVGKLYSRFPIVPGQLNYVAKTEFASEFEIEKLTSLFSGSGSIKNNFESKDFEHEKTTFKIHRPFKIGTEVAWRPFGKWCVLDAMIGLGVKKPFTNDFHAFFEYNFSISTDLFIKNWDMLGIKFSTGRIDEVFKHSLAVMINLRAVEVNVGVSAVAGSFIPSVQLAGVGAYATVCIGF